MHPTAIPIDTAAFLIEAVATIADQHRDLADRRQAMLESLAVAVGADCGFWAWGRGRPHIHGVVPVAMLDFGLDDASRAVIMECGLSAEIERDWRLRVNAQLGQARCVATIWSDVYSAEEWAGEKGMHTLLERGGWSSWLHAVRYDDQDTWSNLFLLRDAGKAEFAAAESAIAALVLDKVAWLHSSAGEWVPAHALSGLTLRQRTVMLMILDGLPRKSIADRLEISPDTVSDHLKAIYARFGVNSSSQLAAIFLRKS